MSDLIRINKNVGVDPNEVMAIELVRGIDDERSCWIEIRMNDNTYHQSELMSAYYMSRLEQLLRSRNPNIRVVPRIVHMPKLEHDPSATNGAFDMKPGDDVIYTIDGKIGTAIEFLQDGDAYVRWRNGGVGCVKWNHLKRYTA